MMYKATFSDGVNFDTIQHCPKLSDAVLLIERKFAGNTMTVAGSEHGSIKFTGSWENFDGDVLLLNAEIVPVE